MVLTITNNRKVVAVAGIAEALVEVSTRCQWVIITAETDNTGVVVIGGSSVVAALATRKGLPLFAGESLTILITELLNIFLDVTVSGEGVTYLFG